MHTDSLPSPSPEHRLSTANFRHTCGYCGCVFRVDITWQAAYHSKAVSLTKPYSCPECRRDSRVKTSTEPRITLVSKRTDGRSDYFPERGL
ncbi:hypothetical protein [Methylococcus sp. EFPC2]|uniref:hypothetical protein n=1 Tax=Methylococcus sp. EFPC2 TaxID=2812648 RepID=UPI00196857A8|nr:hypothetical protein [Methylococcus sp. EFPC2]QSA97658.1 hypothetical protein JWZ97_02130 [Methylococcus sp. EFPC2]